MINFKTGFKNNSFVIGSKIHPWILNKDLLPNSKAFDLQGICLFDGLYSDTYQYNYVLSNGCTLKLSNSSCFINTSVYTNDLETSHPVYVFYDIDGFGSINSKQFTFVNDLNEVTFINKYNENTYTFEGTSYVNSKKGCIIHGLQEKQYLKVEGDLIPNVVRTPGFALLNGENLKGYLSTGGADVGLVNATSNKSLQNRDDGTLTFDDKLVLLLTTTKKSNPYIGEFYFDIDKGYPLFWNGVGWVKADGMLP